MPIKTSIDMLSTDQDAGRHKIMGPDLQTLSDLGETDRGPGADPAGNFERLSEWVVGGTLTSSSTATGWPATA
ncbi:MAG: hypothetical protein R2864_05130 [Syntrophotaleaceae bacterium]